MEKLTPKMLVAAELLDRGLQMYFDQAYFAAIHLAGGAEEILGTYVTRTGGDNAFKSLQNAAVRISALRDDATGASKPKDIRDIMTYARNRTKHIDPVGDDEVLFDPRVQAKDLLDRAVTDYYHLMNYLPLEETELVRRFNELRQGIPVWNSCW
jgi:hypothetical protein